MQPEQPIFLERESYRRRRLGDAAKLSPLLGLVLFLMPVLWAGDGSTAGGVVFLFAVWAFLIVAMLFLSRRLKDSEPKGTGSESDPDDVV